MSEFATPGFSPDAAFTDSQARISSPELEAAIDEFRRWFTSHVADNGSAIEERQPRLDLATLLSHFVALRQEVNLQTRAVRAQQEQNAELIYKLNHAVEQLSRARTEAAEDKQRSLINSLLEICDALILANREVAKARENLLPALEEMIEHHEIEEQPSPPPAPPSARSFWQRWFQGEPPTETVDNLSRREQLAQRHRQTVENAERVRSAISAIVAGYSMSLDRVERALRKHGLEPILTVGEIYDPERMEAMDTVANSGRPNGEVVEEIRRGYLWNGRVYRCAAVRVARG